MPRFNLSSAKFDNLTRKQIECKKFAILLEKNENAYYQKKKRLVENKTVTRKNLWNKGRNQFTFVLTETAPEVERNKVK